MNIRFALPIALILGAAVLPACGDKAADFKNAAENMADMTPDKALEAFNTAKEGIAGLGDLTDVTALKDKATSLLPSLDMLSKAKGLLGDKMPDLTSLGGVVTTLKEKFAGKADFLTALAPLFEKIKGLLG